MASTEDIYRILLDVNGKLGQHSERFDSIEDKLNPIAQKVDKHDKAITGMVAVGSFIAVLGGLFIGGIKAAISNIVGHG